VNNSRSARNSTDKNGDGTFRILFNIIWVEAIRVLDGRAHWRQLANAVKRLCAVAVSGSNTGGGDAACFQITLGNLH